MARRALLIGIDAYQADSELAPLTGPKYDVELLTETLRSLNYQVTPLIQSDGKVFLSPNNIIKQVRDFCADAETDDTLIISFSGHGLEWANQRLLLPADYDPAHGLGADAVPSVEKLLPPARASRAKSVIFIIDACRVPAHLEPQVERRDAGERSSDSQAFPIEPVVAVLWSCASEQGSYGKRGEPSFFIGALADVLNENNDFATLGAIHGAVAKRLPRQQPALEEITRGGRSASVNDLIIKETRAQRFEAREKSSHWCQWLMALPLFSLAQRKKRPLAKQILALALATEERVRDAERRLPSDRWRDDRALFRLLTAIDRLASPDQTHPPLNAAEAAVALAVPFVYEAVLAGLTGLLELGHGRLDPLAPSENLGWSTATRAWAQAVTAEPGWQRRRQLLTQRDKAEIATDILVWQLTAFAHEQGELWCYAPRKPRGAGGWLNPELDQLFSIAPTVDPDQADRVRRTLDGRRLIGLACLMFGGVDSIELAMRTNDLAIQRETIGGVGAHTIDGRKLAHLLALAADLALDARRLPKLVVEHLGMEKGFDLAQVQMRLSKSDWQQQQVGEAWRLRMDCPFAALDAALVEVVERIDRHRRRLSVRDGAVFEEALHLALPPVFSADGVRPDRDADRGPAYEREHVRFALDPERIFTLLMGKELYGDPKLALREMFQNGLDACRYRRARVNYLRKSGAIPPPEVHIGRIIFSAGVREGRPFIACEDNGIGMARQHVTRLFARAGRRFTDSHEFHLDKAKWEEAGVGFWPNSRFGIGVLSYFMLADEIEIETRRIGPDGFPDREGLKVRINGSGSLFRIATDERYVQRDGGTRVTLYLADVGLDPEALLKSVEEWLWLPEVETLLRVEGGSETLLKAGEPTTKMREECGPLIPVPISANSLGQPRVFWAPERLGFLGSLLADGIHANSENAELALAINLTEDWPATLSVDRLTIHPPQEFRVSLNRLWERGGAEALLDWSDVTAVHLATLSLNQPIAIHYLDRAMRRQVFTGELPILRGKDVTIPIHSGISWADVWIANCLINSPDKPEISFNNKFSVRLFRDIKPRLQQIFSKKNPCESKIKLLSAFFGNTDTHSLLPLTISVAAAAYSRELHNVYMGDIDVITPGSLMDFKKNWHFPMDEIIQAVNPLMSFGLMAVDIEKLSTSFSLTNRQWQLLSKNLNGQFPWVNSITPRHFFQAVLKWKVQLSEIILESRDLLNLGLITFDLNALPENFSFSKNELSLLSYVWDSSVPQLRTVGLYQLLDTAEKWKVPISEVVTLARPLVPLGLVDIDLDQVPTDSKLSELQFALIDEWWGHYKDESAKIGVWELMMSARTEKIFIRDLIGETPLLIELGLCSPKVIHLADIDDQSMREFYDCLHCIRWPDPDHLDALAIAAVATREKRTVTSYLPMLEILEKAGVEMGDALEFARFCEAEGA